MTKVFKAWALLFILMAGLTIAGPFFASQFGDGSVSETMAFSQGGPLGLGYDYIGRPIAPQLLSGGQELLIASVMTALLSRVLGFWTGVFLVKKNQITKALRLILDVFLVLPMVVVTLASYQAFNGSVYAIVPAACVLTLPFSSRYYSELIRPIFQSGYFIYAGLRETSFIRLILKEPLPVLMKNLLTDISQAFISSIYMLSSVTFLGSLSGQGKFIWPQMVARNLSGFELNPWACLAPLIAILLLTVPLGSCIDALERRR